MVQKSHPWGVIWVPSNRPQIGHLSEKKWRLSCPVWRCPWLVYMMHVTSKRYVCLFARGGIQQLRGPYFTQFWPPPLLEWTIVDILKCMIPTLCHMTKRGFSTDPLPTSSCPRNYWMTPSAKYCFQHQKQDFILSSKLHTAVEPIERISFTASKCKLEKVSGVHHTPIYSRSLERKKV